MLDVDFVYICLDVVVFQADKEKATKVFQKLANAYEVRRF